MKLQISILSSLLIVAAFAVGWWLGNRTEAKRLEALKAEFARREAEIEDVAESVAASTWINRGCLTSRIRSTTRRKEKWTSHLLLEIFLLADASQRQPVYANYTLLTCRALELLGVTSETELKEVVRNAHPTEVVREPFLDQRNANYEAVWTLVSQALERQRKQPSYPARIWLEGIKKGDLELLSSAYSSRVRLSTGDHWAERLEAYRSDLKATFGEVDYAELLIEEVVVSKVDGVADGEVEVRYGDEVYRKLPVLLEDDAWKLDDDLLDACID